jgi:hypothetical protein
MLRSFLKASPASRMALAEAKPGETHAEELERLAARFIKPNSTTKASTDLVLLRIMECAYNAFPDQFQQQFPIAESQIDQVPAFDTDDDWDQVDQEIWDNLDRIYDEARRAGESRLRAYELCVQAQKGRQGKETELRYKLDVWGWWWNRLSRESVRVDRDYEIWAFVYETEKIKGRGFPRKQKPKGKKR